MDVLTVIRRHAESHRALAESDAYSAQEAPRLEAVLAAVAELIDCANAVRQFLRSPQWGNFNYMEGSEVYGDLEDVAKAIDAALQATKEVAP